MDVTPVMTCVFVVMCCSMLVLLYYFYDHLGASLLAAALQKCSRRQGERGGFRRGLPPAPAGCRSPCPGIRVHGALPGGVLGPRWPGLLLTAALLCSLRDHRDFLPGLLYGPLQLPVAIGPEAAIWQMQVSSQVAFSPALPGFLPMVLLSKSCPTAAPWRNHRVSCFLACEAPSSASMI